MRLFIGNMMCERCRLAVASILDRLALPYTAISIGEARIDREALSAQEFERLQAALQAVGLDLLQGRSAALVDRIHRLILQHVYENDAWEMVNFSVYLSRELQRNYTYLANLFSRLQGRTIEQCLIGYRIQRVKELLCHDVLSLTQIAHLLHYSSVGHLSAQFRKITGTTPTAFRQLRQAA